MDELKKYMAVGNDGRTLHGLTHPPRKALLERLGRRSARKQYQDGKNGKVYHTGYIVAGVWWTLYEVIPFMREA